MTRTTVDEQKSLLVNSLVLARMKVLEAVNSVPLDRTGEVFLGTWSIEDLVAHLEGWDYTNLQAVQEILDGNYPAFFRFFDKDWGSYNEQLVNKYKRSSLEEQLNNARVSHRSLVGFLESLPARVLLEGKARRENGRSVTIRNLLRAEAKDEEKHAGQILSYFLVT